MTAAETPPAGAGVWLEEAWDPEITLTGPDAPTGGEPQELVVFSPAPSISGGTDQVQRNIIGERVLGLPKEPGPSRDTPLRDLLKNEERGTR